MTLIALAVRQRTSVLVLTAILIVFGVYNYVHLPREAAPDITIPYAFISTEYRGVPASDIETSITIPIEKKLKGLEGVKKISSVSSEGASQIAIEFVTGTDIDEALQKVRNKVDEAKNELPGDLENDPMVFEVNFSEMPIVVFSLSGTCGNPCLKTLAEDLKDEFESIPGVLEVKLTGGLEREIRVEVAPDKLAYYGIPIMSLQRVIAGENTNTSGGAIHLGDGRYQLRVPGEMRSPEEFMGLVVGTQEGSPVYLKDVATVVDAFKEEASRSRLDGRVAVNITVKKRAGENVLPITAKMDEVIEHAGASWPPETRITKLMDRSKEIRHMVADLENHIYTGLCLVVAVLMFVMGVRNSVLVSLAIPFSMLISFSVFSAIGITLNNVVLFSLTLALGLLVDDAIVVVESIYRHMEQGVPRLKATVMATSEVAAPVISSTVTTLAAFFPMLFWPGIMGEFMSYLPLTLIITLTASLFVALVINPAMGSLFMKARHQVAEAASDDEIRRRGEAPAEIKGPVLNAYTALLRWALRHRAAVVAIALMLIVLMFQIWLLAVGIEKPVEFFPDIDPASAYINVDFPEGADLDYADRVLMQIETSVNGPGSSGGHTTAGLYALSTTPKRHATATGLEYFTTSDIDNIEHIYTKCSTGMSGGSAFDQDTANHVGIQFLDFAERTESSKLTLERIRGRVEAIPGGRITIQSQEHGPPTGAPINIEISGDDYRVLGELASEVRRELERVPHVTDVRDDFETGTPSVVVSVDRQKAALFGLSTDAVGFALKTGYNGLDVSTFREAGEDYDITVQLKESDRRVTDVLRELIIPAPDGRMVPLTSIAEITYAGSIGRIVRINSERVVSVKANVDELKVPGPVARAEAARMLESMPLPPGYKIKFTGEFEFQQEAEGFLSKAFMAAVLLIFLVLVAEFNSLSQPFIIMTTVLMSLGGAFLGLAVIGSPFGVVMTGVGVISLAGVVVKNGIMLIDYTNRLIERGMQASEAIVAGGATRLRPVYLTAVTAILGLVPMVSGISFDFRKVEMAWSSESSLWWQSMAAVIISGLAVGTFLTLLVVPVLYSFVLEWKMKLMKRRQPEGN